MLPVLRSILAGLVHSGWLGLNRESRDEDALLLDLTLPNNYNVNQDMPKKIPKLVSMPTNEGQDLLAQAYCENVLSISMSATNAFSLLSMPGRIASQRASFQALMDGPHGRLGAVWGP